LWKKRGQRGEREVLGCDTLGEVCSRQGGVSVKLKKGMSVRRLHKASKGGTSLLWGGRLEPVSRKIVDDGGTMMTMTCLRIAGWKISVKEGRKAAQKGEKNRRAVSVMLTKKEFHRVGSNVYNVWMALEDVGMPAKKRRGKPGPRGPGGGEKWGSKGSSEGNQTGSNYTSSGLGCPEPVRDECTLG